ncbi:MAG: hypothetical protein V4635_03470 [Bacteroidota bacterium]
MSKQKNNPDKNLKNLFEKNKGLGGTDDPFEKEALEGFAALNDKQEAFGLKADLDEKISRSQVFADKKNPATYWMAAAGFLLIVGLSVYFINGSSPQHKDLAVSPIEAPQHEISAPQENSDQAFKKTEQELPQSVTKNRAPELPVDGSFRNKGREIPAATEEPARKLEEPKTDYAADLAYEEKGMAAQTAPIVAKPQVYQPETELSKTEENTQSLEPKKENKTTLAIGKKSKSARTDDTESPAAGAVERYSISESDEKADSVAVLNGAVYPGGENTLNKIIKEKLAGQDADKPFNALLFINRKGEVEKAELIKPSGLTATQQKKLLETLRSLKGFTFISARADTNLGEYHLTYR